MVIYMYIASGCEQMSPWGPTFLGHHKVMIYTYIVVLESSMLHAMFHSNRSTGSAEEDFWKVFTIYGHGGHLGLVTCIIYIHISSPFLEIIHIVWL